MSNTFIGLKQADGSFYPILRDGIAENKQISLTTVRDDQSAVKINLYKKDIDSLDEPEYVDTLLIENLIPHPKTEPTIHLNVNLDENNVLTAEASDPETGKKSDIRVSMVTLPKEELDTDTDPDFTLAGSESDPVSLENDPSEDSDFTLPADMSFDMPEFDAEADNQSAPEDLLPDMPEPDMNTGDETASEDLSFDMPEDGSEKMSFDMPEDFSFDTETPAPDETTDPVPDSDPSEPADAAEESASSIFDLGDFEMPDFDSDTTDKTSAEDLSFDIPEPDTNTTDETSTEDLSFDIPDFDEKDAFTSSGSEELGLNDEAPAADDDFAAKADSNSEDLSLDTAENTASSMSFDMPDLDDFSAGSEEKSSEDTNLSFDMPEDNTSFSMPDNDTGFDTGNTTSFDTQETSSFEMPSGQPDFDESFDDKPEKPKKKKFGFGRKKQAAFSREIPPLYDQDLPDAIDESCTKKKCRIAAVICIICAVLCILAVIGIFLIFPWKKTPVPQAENIVTVEPPSQLHMQPPPEEPAKPEENTIVIIEKETVEKGEVVPEKAEPAPETKQQAVRYRIKWGDTLWDLSDTYYRNPWLYTVIARENKIKNPDVIIAGTYIMIPPR